MHGFQILDIVALFRNYTASNAKFKPNLAPVKFMEEVGEMYEAVLRVHRRPVCRRRKSAQVMYVHVWSHRDLTLQKVSKISSISR